MVAPAEISVSREQLSAILGELQANREALNDLSIRCSMFRFTGGTIPVEAWHTICITSFLTADLAMSGDVGHQDVVRYLALLEKLNESLRDVSISARPRTLRTRLVITDALDQMLSRVRSLGTHLESAIGRGLMSSEESPSPLRHSRYCRPLVGLVQKAQEGIPATIYDAATVLPTLLGRRRSAW